MDVDVGGDVLRFLAGEVAAGLGLERGDDLHRRDHLLERTLQLAGDGRQVLRLQQLEVALDDGADDPLLGAELPGLDEQALLQVARGDAHGVEVLDALEHVLGDVDGDPGLLGHADERVALEALDLR